MTDQHPITPPLELMQEWHGQCHKSHEPFLVHIANCAAQWGADQELEACCEWLSTQSIADALCSYDLQPIADDLRAARRPKPPSLAKTATYELDEAVMRGDCITTTDAMPHLRAALKRLAELEDSND